MSKRLSSILALAVAGLGVFAAIRFARSRTPDPPRYETVRVERGPVAARVTATGTLSALVTVLVGSQVSGRIESIHADFNAHVKKGQVIAKLEPQLLRAAVDQAHANYLAAQAGLEKARAQSTEAERRLARAARLGAEKVVAEAELEAAEAAAAVARASAAEADAAVLQARAALRQAQTNLSYTQIISPIDGVVISRNVDAGQTVAASFQSPTLFSIAQDLTKMQIDTNVAEADVGKIKPNMPVSFSVDAYPGQSFQGTVRQVRDAPQSVQNVVTYDAVVDVDNSQRLLKPGMTATVAFIWAKKDDVLRAPNAALRYRPDLASREKSAVPIAPGARSSKRTVYALRGSEAVPVVIEVGISDGSLTEIVSDDLKAGDLLVSEILAGAWTGASASPARRPF